MELGFCNELCLCGKASPDGRFARLILLSCGLLCWGGQTGRCIPSGFGRMKQHPPVDFSGRGERSSGRPSSAIGSQGATELLFQILGTSKRTIEVPAGWGLGVHFGLSGQMTHHGYPASQGESLPRHLGSLHRDRCH